ncbi:forespore capture DNA-binding protein RefZ [Halalkalibacillus halophilus]|uniref:forespore capture DNA-binding protein RefZ n=1 Tax=Halalkalibacillus halophilus TaxID=392827 RepID=UPI000417CE10|nr:forespore capture DNA-binding protein RefZ [Halalkalibacillus halophilus]
MTDNNSKEKIMKAASELFYFNGFKGTSIRSITERAGVNVSLISYYFKNKQGLLEYLTTSYFEGYLQLLDQLIDESTTVHEKSKLMAIIEEIIQYKYDYFQFTCFIQRELSLDNIFIRELFATYVAKETYQLKMLTEHMTKGKNLNEIEKEALYLQLKSLIHAPFTYANDWQRHYKWNNSEEAFIKAYIKVLEMWFDEVENRG